MFNPSSLLRTERTRWVRPAAAFARVAATVVLALLGATLAVATDSSGTRSELTFQQLAAGPGPSGPVSESAFGPVAEFEPSRFRFEGRLVLVGEATDVASAVLRDDFGYAREPARRQLPEVEVELVQVGADLVPTVRGLTETGHPAWDLIVQPGSVWQEASDGGLSRASLPFSLVGTDANCTHHGTLTFLFGAKRASAAWFQVTQETCLYYKLDLWGRLETVYLPESVDPSGQVEAAWLEELAAVVPAAELAELERLFPGVDVDQIGAEITPQHLTTQGVFYRGTLFRGACGTRYGDAYFCHRYRLPSFSTAKSAFAAVALLHLAERLGPSVVEERVVDWAPGSRNTPGDWEDVTLRHALDMATGNYLSPISGLDEAGGRMSRFFLETSYANKARASYSWPGRVEPGTRWVYHSSDTFLATRAMHERLRSIDGDASDLFTEVVDRIYDPLALSPGFRSTLRTVEPGGQPGVALGSHGLWWSHGDLAKLASFVNLNEGVLDGDALLEPDLLAEALQRSPELSGLEIAPGERYSLGFWASLYGPQDGFDCEFWVPYMSGFGGITVALFPNGVVYYYFSDNEEFAWRGVVTEVDRIAPLCQSR